MSKYDLMPCTVDPTRPYRREHPHCGIAHKRLGVEETMVRMLIRGLKAEGFKPISVYDGGEQVEVKTETQTMDTVFSVDESTITFSDGSDNWGVLIILGNGVDCISDWNVSHEPGKWDEAVDRIASDLWEKHQDDRVED